jgi:alginate O-acetyltransferase complex protein AlgI
VSAYAPHELAAVWATTLILAATLVIGLAITRLRPLWAARVAAWLQVVAAVLGVERLNAGEPAGFRMLAVIGALLYAMKAVVVVEARALGGELLPARRWFGFAALWPGMRPSPFAHPGAEPCPGAWSLVAGGMVRLGVGAVMIALARLAWCQTHSRGLATALLLPGLSLIFHFGVFNLLAGAWRLAGVDCRPLFRAPLRATSLREFWGRRWNLAFSEMTALAVHQPLARHTGGRPAVAAAFVASGLLHELAISVPVKAGYGLPFGYFLLHGGLTLAEGWLARRGWAVDRVPWIGRVWTLGWLVLPLPLLFHPPFLAGVVWPLIGIGVNG